MIIIWSKSTEQQYVFSYRENHHAHPQQKISFTNTTLTIGTPTLNAILIRPEERLYYEERLSRTNLLACHLSKLDRATKTRKLSQIQ